MNAAAASACSVLVLRAGAYLGAVPIASVVEVMRPLPVEALAGAPAFVAGLALIRGHGTPIVDLGALLAGGAAAASAGAGARFVALRAGERRIALRVDEVRSLRRLESAQLDALPPLWGGPTPPAVAALGVLDRELLLVLETARLLPAELTIDAGPNVSA